jgi:hypothetical protein
MDSLDPELWKRIAAVASSWHAILTSIVFGVGLVGAAIKWGPRWARWVASKFWSAKNSPAESPPPAERSSPAESPLRFVIDEQRSFWGPVKSGDLPGTQVFGNWHVTNVSDRDIVLLNVRLENYGAKHLRVSTKEADPEAGTATFDSRNPCRAGRMSEVITDLIFFPEICHGSKPLIADVIFTDNYAEEHRVSSVRFKHFWE